MNDPTQITIHRLIVHKVDHMNYDEPQLSDLESPITDEVASFLRRHIVLNREHRNARSALFVHPSDSKVILRNLCDVLMDDPRQFAPQSRAMAQHLFAMVDRRISPGDLVICTFTEGADKHSVWLALLKMDPEDGFVGERVKRDGRIQFVLKRVPEVLPTGELQKCAFILPKRLRAKKGFDLRVVDQQIGRYGVKRFVASFFLHDFLQCKEKLNQVERTQTFIVTSREWVKAKETKWPEADINGFLGRITETLQDQQVDLTTFAQAVISTADEQNEYLEYMQNQGIEDLTFIPDPTVRSRQARYALFEGDDGLQVRINADAIGEGKTLNPVRDPATNIWTVTISTGNWKRKK